VAFIMVIVLVGVLSMGADGTELHGTEEFDDCIANDGELTVKPALDTTKDF